MTTLNNELFSNKYQHQGDLKMPYVFKKGFVNTLENIKNGKEFDFDEPMYFNFSMKKREIGFSITHRIKFKFNRKIPIQAYSFEVEKTPINKRKFDKYQRGPLPQNQMPNNRAYMNIYVYSINDGKEVRIN